MSPDRTVAVVGMACVFPGAPDLASFWHNVSTGVDAVGDVPADRLDRMFFGDGPDGIRVTRGGFVDGPALDFDPGRFGIMPVAVDGTEPDQLLALRTAADAIDDAGGLDGVARDRIGVILGRGGYLTPGVARLDQRVRTTKQILGAVQTVLPDLDDAGLEQLEREMVRQLGELRPESAIGLVPNLAASRIANRLDLGGPAYTLDAACASSLIAVDSAITELASGRCDVVLAGGVHHCHDVTLWSVFSQLGALSQAGEIRPFSRHADGVLISEGTGVVVLERLDDAERLGHRVYATIRGTGVASDGRDASLMSPRVDGQVSALERAYRAAEVDPSSVGVVEGHGTATPAGDRAEIETLRRVFGASESSHAPRVLGSVKSNIGHAMPAAGAAGLIKAVLAVHHGVVPPTLHADEPNPTLADTSFRLTSVAEPWDQPTGPRRAGVNAFGFGGINAHVVVEQHRHGATPRRRTAPATHGADEAVGVEPERFDVLLFAGRDADDLAAQLAAHELDPAVGRSIPASADGARLAVFDPTPKRLALAARLLGGGRPWRGRNDIWFEPSGLVADGGRIAFLFPGLEPTAPDDLTDVADWFGLEATPIPDAATGLERQGREIFGAGRLLDEALGALGVVPDVMAGHSLGEWTGVFTSEMLPPGHAAEFLDGLEPGGLEVPGVEFLALGCGADLAAELIAGLDGVVVSHDNCPHQSVVCGPEAAVAEAADRAATRRVLAQHLPFRSGFHSPHFAPYLDPVRQHWERMPLQAPRVPLWSATTCSPYPDDPNAVRQLALDHLVHPVRFRELAQRLWDDGVRVFVQLGVGSLAAFVDDTLKDRDQLTVTAASTKHGGLDQLARAACALWVEGAGVDLERLGLSALDPVADVAAETATPGRTVRLSLGSPLVHPPASLPTRRPVSSALADAGSLTRSRLVTGDPLDLELDALLRETDAAAGQVATAFATARSGRRAPVRVPPAPSALPATGRPEPKNGSASTAESETTTLVVDLATFPWLGDHCFYRQPDGWTDASDRFPVVPMTTMVQLLADAAQRARPGLEVVRIEDVRANRWLPAAPSRTVTITARRTGDDRVDATIEGYARATVVLAPARPEPPVAVAPPLRNPRPSPVGPQALYDEHWMFHGPNFQGVRRIDALGDDGVDGAIEALPTPGAFLDNAGQLYGWWVMATVDADFLALPQSIERIELFTPPPTGALVETSVRIVELTPRTVRADLDLHHDGALAVRITGWVDRRFDSDAPLWQMLREPEHHLLASPQDRDWVAVEERWRDSASRELMARRYLDAAEREVYDGHNPRDQRRWLLGRIAAKDAVRHRLMERGHGPVFPIEVPLADAGAGMVVVSGGPAEGTTVAVGDAAWIGVASIAATAIAVEPLSDRGDETDARRRLAAQLERDDDAGDVSFERLVGPLHECGPAAPPPHEPPSERGEYLVAWTHAD